MDLIRMRGAWSGWVSRLYEAVVADGVTSTYDRVARELDARIPGPCAVIDVGCGRGDVAAQLARRRPDLRVLGVDLSPTMIERARLRWRDVSNLELEVADACALRYDAGSFGAAVSIASIKHWPYPMRGLREMARVVRAGGLVCVAEVDPGCTREMVREFASQWRWVMPGTGRFAASYFRRVVAAQGLTPDALERMMRHAGLVTPERVSIEGAPLGAVAAVKA